MHRIVGEPAMLALRCCYVRYRTEKSGATEKNLVLPPANQYSNPLSYWRVSVPGGAHPRGLFMANTRSFRLFAYMANDRGGDMPAMLAARLLRRGRSDRRFAPLSLISDLL